MMSFLVAVTLAGATPGQYGQCGPCGYGGFAGYGEYGGYGWNAWGTFQLPCCLPSLPPPDLLNFLPPGIPSLPPPGKPVAPDDIDRQLEQKLQQMKEILDALEKRLKSLDKKQKKFENKQKDVEDAVQTLALVHEEMARSMEHKLAELQIMSRALELKIGEESLRQKSAALAERTRAVETAEKQRQEMARLEDSVRALEKKPAQDPLSRVIIRDLEQQIAALEAIMKTKMEVIEDRVGALAKNAQEDRLRQHFTRLDERMRKIEEHFQQGQKAGPAFLSNRALLTVRLPTAAAKLFVNGQPVQGESAQRSFLTPELKIGTTYTYTLRMETMQNGAMTSASRNVYFRAGKAVHVSFEDQGTSTIRPAVSP
jgi:uncharacterized protein (TIGR03000 family)